MYRLDVITLLQSVWNANAVTLLKTVWNAKMISCHFIVSIPFSCLSDQFKCNYFKIHVNSSVHLCYWFCKTVCKYIDVYK